ncbi:MAG: hypothetical protein R3200_12840 [Xanthomonadales bacterium]|nr:hypothetical protein [Xanthomonadales bacterium]
MTYHWHDFVGNIGVALILLAYLLLQVERMDPRRLPYSVVNALGAGLILVSLAIEFNLSAFLIESFWIAISVVGIVRAWTRRSAPESE